MTTHLYFIGIAGHTVRGLALAERDRGAVVSGLDETAVPPGSDWLDEHRIIWHRNFHPAQLDGVTAVIVTGQHATADYPAIVEARRRGLPIKSWAQLVGEATAHARVIAVAGTHGKTTTTAYITWLMEAARQHPDYVIGIKPFNFDTSVRLAGSEIAVIEGDEYKASSLEHKSKVQYYHPDILILTAVEHDHPDFFPDLAAVKRRFAEVVAQLPATGRLIACAETPAVLEIAAGSPAPVTTYGLEVGDYTVRDVAYLAEGIEFDVLQADNRLGRIATPLYGKHNVLNALAGTAAVIEAGLTIEDVIAGAAGFRGASRRFNLLTEPEQPVTVIDDYAHHPSEVATTIEAAKLHFQNRRLVVVFRPHTYSRTQALLTEYQQSFGLADEVYIAPIEGAREAAQEATVSGQDIVDALKGNAHYVTERTDLADQIVANAQAGDVVLCMSVSGYDRLAEELVDRTRSIH